MDLPICLYVCVLLQRLQNTKAIVLTIFELVNVLVQLFNISMQRKRQNCKRCSEEKGSKGYAFIISSLVRKLYMNTSSIQN